MGALTTLLVLVAKAFLTNVIIPHISRMGKGGYRINGSSQAVQPSDTWTPAYISDFPYYVEMDGCAGVLISDQWVLTAAGCVTSREKPITHVIVAHTCARQSVSVENIFVHPEYIDIPNLSVNDIALLKLSQPLHLHKKLWPVRLPKENEDFEDDSEHTFVVKGARNKTGRLSHRLKTKKAFLYSTDSCISEAVLDEYQYLTIFFALLNDTTICSKGVDKLPSNAGSPIVKDDILFGLALYEPDTDPESTMFLTKISHHVPWIRSFIGNFEIDASQLPLWLLGCQSDSESKEEQWAEWRREQRTLNTEKESQEYL